MLNCVGSYEKSSNKLVKKWVKILEYNLSNYVTDVFISQINLYKGLWSWIFKQLKKED